jgi:hypothetical protein
MRWFALYIACGVSWWIVNAPLKEHVSAFRELGLLSRLVYVFLQFLAIAVWPLAFIGWCILRYRGIDPKEHGEKVAKQIDDYVSEQKRIDAEKSEREQEKK